MEEVQYPTEFNQLIPRIFIVEPVLGCDLKCPECAVGGNRINKKKGWMRFEQFKIIADKIRPYCKILFLHHNGEPMLNKDIYKMIKYAATFCRTNISTNGQTLTEEKAEKLIASGVAEIIVSIDGFSQKIYERYRVGGSAGKALWALKMLQDFNLKYGNKVHIMAQFCVFKHNQHEMSWFNQFCNSIGLNPLFKAPLLRPDSRYENADHPKFKRPQLPDKPLLRKAMKKCGTPKQDFTILLDGTCVLCCADNNGITNYGNIYQQDVLGIWNSPNFKKDRWDIITGNAPEFCVENCLSWSLYQQETA